MPELPDIELYCHALRGRIVGRPLVRAQVAGPFLLRTYDPPLREAEARPVVGVERLGKRVVWEMEGELFLAFHLMLAGRFRWHERPPAKAGGKVVLALFDFPNGSLTLQETGSHKRASLHVVAGRAGLAKLDYGGLEVLTADLPAFEERLRSESHTLKRALTDPRLFAGIGNAYSDEILWAAGLSPVQLTGRLAPEQIVRLYEAARTVLGEAVRRLTAESGERFPAPEHVTPFRPEFAVHGKFGRPCPRCATTVEHITYAENEANYCPRCQTEGGVLADRALSQLLRGDWPRTIESMEELRARRGLGGCAAAPEVL